MLDFARERDAKLTGRSEILALLGLLHLAGITKSVRLNIEQLWAKRNLQTYYVCCGTRFLMRYIRFDGKGTRTEKNTTDKPYGKILSKIIKTFMFHQSIRHKK
jgi:hypothetical protein